MDRQLKIVGFEVTKKHQDDLSLMDSIISLKTLQDSGAACITVYPRDDEVLDKDESVKVTVNWKPLSPKNAEDVYFGGTKSKKIKQKIKHRQEPGLYKCEGTNDSRAIGSRDYDIQESEIWDSERMPYIKGLMIDELESLQCDISESTWPIFTKLLLKDSVLSQRANPVFWNHNRVKEIFPSPVNQEELVDESTEEIRYLNLEDCKVYTKKVPKEMPPQKLWKSHDFPCVENTTRERFMHHYDCKAQLKSKTIGSEEKSPFFMLPDSENSYNGSMEDVPVSCSNKLEFIGRQNKTFCSTSSQTDETLFSKSFEYVSYDDSFYQNLPSKLKEIFLGLLNQQNEHKKIISYLLRLLSNLNKNLLLEAPFTSPSWLYSNTNNPLSPSEKECILSFVLGGDSESL